MFKEPIQMIADQKKPVNEQSTKIGFAEEISKNAGSGMGNDNLEDMKRHGRQGIDSGRLKKKDLENNEELSCYHFETICIFVLVYQVKS